MNTLGVKYTTRRRLFYSIYIEKFRIEHGQIYLICKTLTANAKNIRNKGNAGLHFRTKSSRK